MRELTHVVFYTIRDYALVNSRSVLHLRILIDAKLALVNLRKGKFGTAAGREQNVQGGKQNSML
jgi:hypothetical protein